ncbi:MAG: DNA-processing protein DprA [Rikenellaceae bacterium]|nr:DNA-processing protein DprA [Rikenellaceae bacterium]MCL2692985.1 DNA-processing protein DprA [Rikenellaceae bacterium]
MIIDDIALTMLPQVGPRTAVHLLQHFGTAEAIFAASQAELTGRAELRDDIARAIVRKSFHAAAERELRFCERNGVVPIASTSENYPGLLSECPDYPHVLYYRGELSALGARRMLSMVGTRRITAYGHKVCDRLVGEIAPLAPDCVIVSGLAFGVDGACHRAALAAGLTTVGVLAGPLTEIYPAQHASLAEEMIRRGGGILSEYHSAAKHKGVTFVPRNRIIAGMSAGTVIVESALKGGSIITANMADGYNRCVMAVPGRVGDTCSEGTNELIRSQRARMICSGADVLREMDWDFETNAAKTNERDLSSLSRDAAGLFACLPDGEAVSIDGLAEITGLTPPELAAIILELEFERLIRVLPGKMYERA